MTRNFISFIRLRSLFAIFCLSVFINLTSTNVVSAEVQKNDSYLIKINRVYNTITIYEKDEKGDYSIPVKSMLCSVGAKGQTKIGTFQTKEKYRWKLLMGDVWGQYATRIVGGILFHSVYYYQSQNPATLATKEYNKLGTAASHGCVRLSVADAKWIYDNCGTGTTVVIYDDKRSPGPLGKPKALKIPATAKWDPTDPNQKNPFNVKEPEITGVKNHTITVGDKIDLLKGVKAKSSLGEDITSHMILGGKVDSKTPGEYNITYTITDAAGKTVVKTITVKVKKAPAEPKLVGVSDRAIKASDIVDEKFALSGVEAYNADKKISKNSIIVTIDKISEEEYYITYELLVGKKTVTQDATFQVDLEAPVFRGVTDKVLKPGKIPNRKVAMSGVSIHDNFTKASDIIVDLRFDRLEDGSYQVTYEAVDKVGNKAEAQAIFHN